MGWKWVSSSHPISDIRDWNNAKRLEVRPDFQRQEVWSEAAKIMLMDTILKNIPMPKIFLQAIIRSSDTYRIIIDGQQRIKAILSFLEGGFKLAKPYDGEYMNCRFDELKQNVKEDFLAYKIDINEIINAPEEIVREIYSRVNKYTIVLNKQELRRADFPGDFLKLSEELALHEFFEDSKIFSVVNRRRMGDIEYISELLAILIEGLQDKRETLDRFYQDYSQWNKEEVNRIRQKFEVILTDILLIFPPNSFSISKTRFKQKADFYSLFAAINEFHSEGYSLKGKNVNKLREDIETLNFNIAPESEVKIFSEYAIKCVSQGNTIGSRTWRKDFLKNILQGTYIGKLPTKEIIRNFHNILWDLHTSGCYECPPYCQECPICKKEIKDYNIDNVILTWPKLTTEFQISNAEFIHIKCIEENHANYYFISY